MKFTLKNNELTATRKLDFFESLIMEAMESEENMPTEAREDVRKGVDYLLERLDGEMGGTTYKLAQDWFAGLAVHIPFENHDILERAKSFGVLAVNAGDDTLDNFLTGYFGNLVSALFGLRAELKI
tara:strand:+ start:668 stop:1045 length:378 start_codon:yes stop_codon:yes gene_type:complete